MQDGIFISFDVEEMHGAKACKLTTKEQILLSHEGLEIVSQCLDENKIKANFFITTTFAKQLPGVLNALKNVHELASHGVQHNCFKSTDLIDSKQILEDLLSKRILGFRSPRFERFDYNELFKAGYAYDSSLNPTWMPGRYNNLFSPRLPFMKDNILIYPTSVTKRLRLPLFWAAFHLINLDCFINVSRKIFFTERYLNLYFHPWEFSPRISRYTKMPFRNIKSLSILLSSLKELSAPALYKA